MANNLPWQSILNMSIAANSPPVASGSTSGHTGAPSVIPSNHEFDLRTRSLGLLLNALSVASSQPSSMPGASLPTPVNALPNVQPDSPIEHALVHAIISQLAALGNTPTVIPQTPTSAASENILERHLVQPVGHSPNDKTVLINTLVAGRVGGLSDRMAIQNGLNTVSSLYRLLPISLNGKQCSQTNGHTAEEWIDYLLLHYAEINVEVSKWAGPATESALKDRQAPDAASSPPTAHETRVDSASSKKRPNPSKSTTPTKKTRVSADHSHRHSKTLPVRLPKIEEPTPPTPNPQSKDSQGRYPYTQADDRYMVAYFKWQLQKDIFTDTRSSICKKLAEKVCRRSISPPRLLMASILKTTFRHAST